ncbi:hypothetical protein ACWEWU_14790, partial [Staphylococcus xylosus]
ISEEQSNKISPDVEISLEESVVYILSKPLGGRDSVLNTPFNELLGHLITYLKDKENEAYKEQVDFYMNFIALLHSNPTDKNTQKMTEKFINEIKPRTPRRERTESKFEWPERTRKKIEARKNAESVSK